MGIQYVATTIILIVIAQLTIKIVRDKISFVKSFISIFFWLITLILIWVPEIMAWLGRITGVGRGVDVLIYISIIFLFYYVLRQNSKIDRLEKNITKIVREISKNETKK